MQNWVLNIPSYILLVDDGSVYLNYFLLDSGYSCWWTTADEDKSSHRSRRGGNLKRPRNKKVSKGLKFHQKIVHRGGRHVLIWYQTSLLYCHELQQASQAQHCFKHSHSIFSLFVNTFACLTGLNVGSEWTFAQNKMKHQDSVILWPDILFHFLSLLFFNAV